MIYNFTMHSIGDKLASTLATLKRREMPVDRLLKLQQQQPLQLSLQISDNKSDENPNKQIPSQGEQISLTQSEQRPATSPTSHHESIQNINDPPLKKQSHEKQLQREESPTVQRGFLQSLRDYLLPIQPGPISSIPSMNRAVENLSSQIEINRVRNFGQLKSEDDGDIDRVIQTGRPYSQREFYQAESSRIETNNSYEFVPSCHFIRHTALLHGIAFYFDEKLTLTDPMIEQGRQLAFLLSSLAQQVFYLPIQSIYLFRDIDSARIAFNTNGSSFYNVRYFEQVYWDDLQWSRANGQLSSSSSSIVRRIVNFYYMVTCHELSHNIDSNHDLNFINRLERVSVRFMDEKDAFLARFSFQ